MVTLTPVRKAPPQIIVARVAAYFGSVGLVDEVARQEAARLLVERVQAAWPDAGPEDLSRHSVTEALSEVEQWLDRLAAEAPPSVAADVRRQIAWYVREPLRRHPDAFLKDHALPDAFVRAVYDAAAPVVPDEAPSPMERQHLGGLPEALHVRFWREVARQLLSVVRSVLRVSARK